MSKGHAVIDGSNLATEGRSEPNLKQLNEAVDAIAAEYDFAQITVIVDATFEHRVASAETKAARKAIDDNKIITPPAGVIGRGDAFILQVADRANAVVFSNDSFQEFHANYEWLFDDGRLIGGKPIPSVGWIYVPRSPVRGPVSRRVTADKRRAAKPADKPKSKAANTPTPDKEPVERAAKPSRRRGAKKPSSSSQSSPQSSPQPTGDGTNDPDAWKSFKTDYPVGSTIAATVDRFSSHGAYGSVDNVVIYLPNRLLGDPAPTKARDVLDLGATMDFIVDRYDEERYGIDAGRIAASPSGRRLATKRTAKKSAAKPSAAKAPAKKAAAKAPAKKAASRRAPAKKAPAKKVAAKNVAAKKAPAKKTAAKNSTARRAPAKKAPAKKVAAKRAPAKKTAAKKAAKKRR